MSDATQELNGLQRRETRRNVLLIPLAIIALAAIVVAIVLFVQRGNETEQQRDAAVSAADELCGQVRELGGLCVVDPDDLRGEPGPEGPPGPGPTDEQVAAAVARYLDENPPQPGRPPTLSEIADAVAVYLAANPPERGERGPGPTSEQVAGAVAAYLLANPAPAGEPGPVGPAGEDGTDGVDGAAGPAGPEGPPGPSCPAGWHPEQRQVLTPPETWIVCVPDEGD